VNFFNDPEFLDDLATQKSYKQDFDEAFQDAVILGYKSGRDLRRNDRPTLV
jgi:hypothetical protein